MCRFCWLGLVISSLVVGCTQPARSPECNAIINRCMDQCADEPAAISPREQAVATGETSSLPQSPCEQRCSNKCK